MFETKISIGKLTLKNPVLVASGTFGYGDECTDLIDLNKLGGFITKSISLKPREGNRPPRISETTSGMLNSIGLANIGVEKFTVEKLPFLRTLGTAVIVNIAGNTIEEYTKIISILEKFDGIDGYEINISCPNVKEGGLHFGTNTVMTGEITRKTRAATDKTLIVKLTPNVTRISELAHAAAEEGADAVSLINTLIGMAIDIETKKPKLSTVTGGLSGPAIKPVALAKVYEVAQNVKIPIIGIGGIMTAADAIEFFIAGACAVQIGSANFIDPETSSNIIDGLIEYGHQNNLNSVRDLIGILQISN